MVGGKAGEPGAAEIITVRTAGTASTVVVEPGSLDRLGGWLATREYGAGRLFVVSDEDVWAAQGALLAAVLDAAEVESRRMVLPAGEESKSLHHAGDLYAWLAAERAERREPLLAFGGGVIGDLAGFVAATYLRGVPFIQVPTSLLAMVDSSVGGKTGVNLPAGKNLVGAFLQPDLVIVDPALLRTLPDREQRSGWAEVVKYAFFDRSVPDLALPPLLPILLAQRAALRALDGEQCAAVIAHCLRIKAAVVEQDERETGLRRILNLGHTIGHAIEATAGYGRYTHGEAVALGLRAVARLGARSGLTGERVVAQLDELLDDFGLPTRIEGCAADALLDRIGSDKKVRAGRVHWIVPTTPGEVTITAEIALDDVRATLLSLGAS